MSRALRAWVLPVVAGVVLAGCTPIPQGEPSAPPSSASVPASDEGDPTSGPTSEPTPDLDAHLDVTDTPGTLPDFVGALVDAEVVSFEQADGAWRAEGTVTNSSQAAAVYRVYASAMADGGTSTRGVVQIDVPALAPGETAVWDTEFPLVEDDLTLVLRVERAATS